MKTLILTLVSLVSLLGFASCGGHNNTPESVIERIAELPEHRFMYYAPLHIGRHVLTGDDHQNSSEYINTRFGKLIEQGLISVSEHEKNAWRTVIDIELTEQGKTLVDKNRCDNEHAYVAVCQLVPDTVLNIGEYTTDSIVCQYTASIQNLTPFGEFMNFEQGKEYQLEIKLEK